MCKQETTPSKPYYTESYKEEDKVVEESSDGIRLAQEADVWVGGEHHDKYVEEQSDDIVTDDEEDGDGQGHEGDGDGTDSDGGEHEGSGDDTDSDDEDALPLDGTVAEDIRFTENEGLEYADAFNPETMPEFVEIKTGKKNDIPGFKSLFNIHTPKTCCTKQSPKESSVVCTTKNTKHIPLKYSSKNLHTAEYSCNSNGVDPAGVLCYSKLPKPIPIQLSPSSCLPPSVPPSACTNPTEQIYVPEAIDPIKYNVRKYILNPKQPMPVYKQATLVPPRDYTDGGQLIDDSHVGIQMPYDSQKANGTFAVQFN